MLDGTDSAHAKCSHLKDFLTHLLNHIWENFSISCPFKNCDKLFTVKSSFTVHISQIHIYTNTYHLSFSVVQYAEQQDNSAEILAINESTSGAINE